MEGISFLAVIVAAIVSFVVGMLWYSPVLFGKIWMKHMKITEEDMQKSKEEGMTKQILLGFITSLVAAYSFGLLDAMSTAGVFYIAFVVWLGFQVTIFFENVLWEKKPFPLFVISAGYKLATVMATALVFFYL